MLVLGRSYNSGFNVEDVSRKTPDDGTGNPKDARDDIHVRLVFSGLIKDDANTLAEFRFSYLDQEWQEGPPLHFGIDSPGMITPDCGIRVLECRPTRARIALDPGAHTKINVDESTKSNP